MNGRILIQTEFDMNEDKELSRHASSVLSHAPARHVTSVTDSQDGQQDVQQDVTDPIEAWGRNYLSDADKSGNSESDENSSTSGNRSNVHDCARKPQTTAASRRRGSKKRKAYSNKDYRMIINAPSDAKRRAIAEALEMPWKTALGIMRRFKKNGKVHDARKDHHGDSRDPRRNPYSDRNRGKWGKLAPEYEDYLFHLVHFNCAKTMTDMLELLNREIMRDFLLENQVLPTNVQVSSGNDTEVIQSGIIFGIKALPEGERHKGDPLDVSEFEQVKEFQIFCDRYLIKSPQTIVNHLNKAGYTRKNIIIERETANKPSAMTERLRVAQLLRAVVNGESSKKFLIFQDEIPFLLNRYRKRGLAKKGQRAVYRGVPTSNMSFRTQVSMAVNPDLGLLVAKQYNPQKVESVDQQSSNRKVKGKSGHTIGYSEDFVHLVMTNVMALFATEDSKKVVENAQIVLVVDGALEHGSSAMNGIVSRFEHKERFDKLLAEHGCTFRHVKLPPNSPHMNLCEYYNRILRSYVGYERNKHKIHREMMQIQGDTEGEPCQIVTSRVDNMHDCIELAFERLRNNHSAVRDNFMNFSRWLQKIVDTRGYLNYYEPM